MDKSGGGNCFAKTSILLLTTFFSNVSNALSINDLNNELAKYCIPPENSNCDPTTLAEYKNNKCVCKYESKGYFWDAETRKCKYCSAGSYRIGNSCNDCESGHYCTGGYHNELCSIGTYSATSGKSSCDACASPTITDNSSGIECGSYTKTTTTYCNGTGNTSSTDKPISSVETFTKDCVSGYVCNNGKCEVDTCPAGYGLNGKGLSYMLWDPANPKAQCKACGIGTYNNGNYANCQSCSGTASISGYLYGTTIGFGKYEVDEVCEKTGTQPRNPCCNSSSGGMSSSHSGPSISFIGCENFDRRKNCNENYCHTCTVNGVKKTSCKAAYFDVSSNHSSSFTVTCDSINGNILVY